MIAASPALHTAAKRAGARRLAAHYIRSHCCALPHRRVFALRFSCSAIIPYPRKDANASAGMRSGKVLIFAERRLSFLWFQKVNHKFRKSLVIPRERRYNKA
jgi:hypothetical protein